MAGGKWEQLGLFCEQRRRLAPQALKKIIANHKPVSKSKPVRKAAPPLLQRIALADLDDPVGDLFSPEWYAEH